MHAHTPELTRDLNLEGGISAERILTHGLVAAMTEVGRLLEGGESYVPEMLVAARAMQSEPAILRPQLAEEGIPTSGKVILGRVRGDIHDIAKNLVGMMLEGAGFEVVDLGADVPPKAFAAAAHEYCARYAGVSALLTTTMKNMREVIEAIDDLGLRHKVKIVVGDCSVAGRSGWEDLGPWL